ncbi:MAG: DUF885 domain-containing protein [bacterium TMED217]|nr:MAG: DUF885 domain-containing protein [bacterium TMED217]
MSTKGAITFLLPVLVIMLLVSSCGETIEPSPESDKLNAYLDKKFDEYVDRHPEYQTYLGIKKNYDRWDDISPRVQEAELKVSRRSLQWLLDSINTDLLNEQALLSYTLYKQKLEQQIADHRYRLYNYPLNQMSGKQSGVPAFLINMHKITKKKDAKDYIKRLIAIRPLFDQLIENLREREKTGVIAPNYVFDHVLNDSKNVISGFPFAGEDSCALFKDFHDKVMDLDVSLTEKDELLNLSKAALLGSVKPAYHKLIGLVNTLMGTYNEEDGVWRLEGGAAFYENALQRTTTTEMSAEEIHQLGLIEVNRIHEEMTTIKNNVGFKGSLKEFFVELKENDVYYYPQTESGKKEYIKEAENIINSFKRRLDDLFITKPTADMNVKSVEAFREKSAGKAFYQRAAPDGSRPGTYYANTYRMRMMPKYQMEALAYHEGIPGHHMQISIAQELKGLPKFRKYGGYTAYVEGWGLYSEYLPKELGFYSDPYSDFGRLAMELWRSCRLVVDTGIHAKKWTREQSIEYYMENTPNDELDCIKMVERHVVYPSQATAYKIGMNKIIELKDRAREILGEKFDIREFHETILARGAVPLNILEKHVEEMIADKLK